MTPLDDIMIRIQLNKLVNDDILFTPWGKRLLTPPLMYICSTMYIEKKLDPIQKSMMGRSKWSQPQEQPKNFRTLAVSLRTEQLLACWSKATTPILGTACYRKKQHLSDLLWCGFNLILMAWKCFVIKIIFTNIWHTWYFGCRLARSSLKNMRLLFKWGPLLCRAQQC